jgi:hypothetical protein
MYKGQICYIEHNKDASGYSTFIFNSSHSFAEIKVVGNKHCNMVKVNILESCVSTLPKRELNDFRTQTRR